jgi:PAS domain S-box-containing protein
VVIHVLNEALAKETEPEGCNPHIPSGRGNTAEDGIPTATVQEAMLRSEKVRITGLIFVLLFFLIIIMFRSLLGGMTERLHLLPQSTALFLASAAYEMLLLGRVKRAIREGRDLPRWAWSLNSLIEASIPTVILLILTESPFMGPYRALSAPASHGYYIFIILSTLRLRPGLCYLTGLASALGYSAAVVYTIVVHPAELSPAGRIYPFQVYVTYVILLLTCGAIAGWLTGQFRKHVLAALRETAIRGQYERLVLEIAQRERAEQALRASERRYRQLMEETKDAIVLANEQGVITLFNRAAEGIFGYPEHEVRGQPIAILMPEEHREAHRIGFHHYLETREARIIGRTVQVSGRRKTGDIFPLEMTLSAIDLPEGVSFLGAIRDLTERQRLQGRIVQAEKLASLGLLSAGVAHEINNPLAYVANNVAILERDFKGLIDVLAAYEEGSSILETSHPEAAGRIAKLSVENDLAYVRENLGAILKSTRNGIKRVSDIVQNLRDFARLDQASIDRVDLSRVIGSCLELIKGRLEQHKIDVVKNLDQVPQIVCAPVQINQVIFNLLLNADQAIVSTGRGYGCIGIAAKATRKEVILEVSDDGCGIPPEIQSRIFDPFFTTKPVGEGTGLGLSISQTIVSDHGGRIELESIPGEGARFRVVLPLDGKELEYP